MNDWDSEEMKALGPEGRAILIMDEIAPRRYSRLKNPDGMDYLYEHKIRESPPGSFALADPQTMAAQSTAYRTPLWYL